jgi:hypothetical protein
MPAKTDRTFFRNLHFRFNCIDTLVKFRFNGMAVPVPAGSWNRGNAIVLSRFPPGRRPQGAVKCQIGDIIAWQTSEVGLPTEDLSELTATRVIGCPKALAKVWRSPPNTLAKVAHVAYCRSVDRKKEKMYHFLSP